MWSGTGPEVKSGTLKGRAKSWQQQLWAGRQGRMGGECGEGKRKDKTPVGMEGGLEEGR